MNRGLSRLLVAGLCVTACAVAGTASWWHGSGYVRTEDRNGDGRPDVWRVYDRLGQISEADVDSNFDGRSDVREYYENNALVRRESDRDFNDRIDRVDEFDPATHDRIRSVVDVDYDGTADLLVLFQGGQAVFSKWAHLATPAVAPGSSALRADAPRRTADGELAPLEDPFRTDLAVRALRAAIDHGGSVGLSTSGGLPAPFGDVVSALAFSSDASGFSFSHPSSASLTPYSPRGPPVSHLLA